MNEKEAAVADSLKIGRLVFVLFYLQFFSSSAPQDLQNIWSQFGQNK